MRKLLLVGLFLVCYAVTAKGKGVSHEKQTNICRGQLFFLEPISM